MRAVLLVLLLVCAGCGRAAEPVALAAPVHKLAAPVQELAPPIATVTAAPSPRMVADGPAAFASDLPDDAVEIAATGDVNLGGRVAELIDAHGADYPWMRVAPVLREADVAIVNLECTISDRGQAQTKEYVFRGDPKSVPAMAAAGVDVATLGNNHAMDYGRDALDDTLAHLRHAGIRTVGAGTSRQDAFRAAIITAHGVRVAFLGFSRVLPLGWAAGPATSGVASAYEENRMLAAVRQARAESDLVVVAIHWGEELKPEPNQVQVRVGRALVDAGAGIILGAHAHVLQPVVRYRGAVIAYSLGNFVFTSPDPATASTMILRVGVLPDRSLVVARAPVRIAAGQPRPV